VRPEVAEGQRNGKSHGHGMDRVARDGDLRPGVVIPGLLGNRIGERLVLVTGPGFGHRWALLRAAVGLLPPVTLAGCEESLSTVHPVGPAAAAIATMWWVLLLGSVAISLLVAALLILAFGRRPGPDSPEAEVRHERVFILGLGLG